MPCLTPTPSSIYFPGVCREFVLAGTELGLRLFSPEIRYVIPLALPGNRHRAGGRPMVDGTADHSPVLSSTPAMSTHALYQTPRLRSANFRRPQGGTAEHVFRALYSLSAKASSIGLSTWVVATVPHSSGVAEAFPAATLDCPSAQTDEWLELIWIDSDGGLINPSERSSTCGVSLRLSLPDAVGVADVS